MGIRELNCGCQAISALSFRFSGAVSSLVHAPRDLMEKRVTLSGSLAGNVPASLSPGCRLNSLFARYMHFSVSWGRRTIAFNQAIFVPRPDLTALLPQSNDLAQQFEIAASPSRFV